MITKPAYRRLCTLTFPNSVFVSFRYSPRSDEKRRTSRNSVAYSSFARSSQLINNRLFWKSVMRSEPIHIKYSVWLWGFRHVNFRPTTQSFLSLSNHTHKLAYYRYSQYVISYSWIRSFMLLDIQLFILCISEDSRDRNKPWSVLVQEMFIASLLNWNWQSKFEKEKDRIKLKKTRKVS